MVANNHIKSARFSALRELILISLPLTLHRIHFSLYLEPLQVRDSMIQRPQVSSE